MTFRTFQYLEGRNDFFEIVYLLVVYCIYCSFKTKGNLTKHMQSKTHYKKCLELGINLGPMPEGEFNENEFDTDQQSINSGGGRTSSVPGESDSDEYSDGNEGETESSGKYLSLLT